MADFALVVVIIAFFALCAALVMGCDRIVRSGDDAAPAEPADAPAEVAP